MPQEPQINGMSNRRRNVIFWTLVLVFIFLLPTMIFYTTGYRLIFDADTETTVVTTTGGMYITTPNLDVDVYLDEEQIEQPRLFRNAYYIQNIKAGQHRIVVQAPEVHTWVKELPVDSHIVIEAAAFNMPTTPRLRPITQYVTSDGVAVYQGDATTSAPFVDATSTQPYVFATSSSIASFTVNPEYEFVETLFGTSTATTTSVFAQFLRDMDRFRFISPEERTATTSTTTPEVIVRNDVELLNRGLELYAVWRGPQDNVPFYFCVTRSNASTTALRYGQHVADAFYASSSASSSLIFSIDDQLCRSEIKLDRLRQDVYLFDFFPGSSDLALLHLEDGLYVTEIDDRSWQNTQPLYLGRDFKTIVENDIIYIEQAGSFFEVVPEIES